MADRSIELGPCNVTQNLTTQLNPYAFNEVSNMLFLSQPVGVGFSYAEEEPGSIDPSEGVFVPASVGGVNGRYAVINDTKIQSTDMAAAAAWEVIQGFYSTLPQLDSNITSKTFNLFTESYGGHCKSPLFFSAISAAKIFQDGPAFFNYFSEQNLMVANGSAQGVALNMGSLGIINGIIDERIQAPYYPEFAANNT